MDMFDLRNEAFWVTCMCILVASLAFGPKAYAGSLPIVEDGQVRAVVVIADRAHFQVLAFANKLATYIEKATGAKLRVVREGQLTEDDASLTQIYVGITAPEHEHVSQALDGLNEDGFVIHSEKRSVSIIGVTPSGLGFAVNDFLERFVGVRWLLPGPIGEDVPQTDTLAIPQLQIRDEPAFLSREIDGTMMNAYLSPPRAEWARNNRLRAIIEFKHNLSNLFPPSLYAQSHPHFYPQGANLNNPDGWQPCFTAPGIDDEAVRRIKEYFRNNPDATSYSLGVNDTRSFCEGDPNHPHYPGETNSIGLVNMSNLYFDWVRQVAEGVFEEYPDKYLGTYAYINVYDPPTSVTLPPNVVVFITDERLSWGDPAMDEEGRSLTEQWLDVGVSLGFYEYMYGTPYALPRTNFHQMAEVYRYAQSVGAKFHYAELYSNFGEGPKAWLASRLQWDPDQDVDELLTEWYVRAVGPEAAPDLAAYFAHWQDFWERRVFETNWYKGWAQSSLRKNFMPFDDDSYLEVVTEEEIVHSRRLLESVVEKARTPEQRARAEYMLRSFEYYEASALSYPRERGFVAPSTTADVMHILDGLPGKVRLAERRFELAKAFRGDPILEQPTTPFDGYGLVMRGGDWSGIPSSEFNAIVDWIRAEGGDGEVTQRVVELATESSSKTLRRNALLMLAVANELPALIRNSSFEVGASGPVDAQTWWYWLTESPSKEMHRSNAVARTGEHSLYARGLHFAGPTQTIRIIPGEHGAYAAYYVPEDATGHGTIHLAVDLLDANQVSLGSYRSIIKRVADTAGRWSSVEWVGEIPAEYNGKRVQFVRYTVTLNNFYPDQEVYIDDVLFYDLELVMEDLFE